jgi:two-component system sensor histidine kinase KdpD
VEKEEEKRVKKVKKWVPDFKPRDYVLSVLMIVPIILLGFLLSYFKIQNFALIFIIGVTASAFLFGMWPSMFVSVLSILAYDFFFVKPIFTFTITNPVYIVELIIFFATSFGVAEIARIFRHQREAIRMRLENIRLLEQMGRELLTMPSIEQLLDNTVEDMKPETRESIQLLNVDILEQVADITSGYIKKAYNVPNLILFKDRDDKIKIWARSDTSIEFTQNDYAIAAWVYTNGELAGRGTKTLVGSKFVFVPMESKTSTVGVIILHGDYSEMLPQEKYFVTAIANFAAISAEKCTTIMGSKK